MHTYLPTHACIHQDSIYVPYPLFPLHTDVQFPLHRQELLVSLDATVIGKHIGMYVFSVMDHVRRSYISMKRMVQYVSYITYVQTCMS